MVRSRNLLKSSFDQSNQLDDAGLQQVYFSLIANHPGSDISAIARSR